MDLSYQTPDEIQVFLGKRLKSLRVRSGLTQDQVAGKAAVSLRSIQHLESGAGSTLETFLRFLKAIGEINVIDTLAPEPTISPMAMLKMARKKSPQRVRRSLDKESAA